MVIGRGAFSKVYLAEFAYDKKLYAIKVLKKDQLIEYDQIEKAKREKDIIYINIYLIYFKKLFLSF